MQIVDLTPNLMPETARVMDDGFSDSGRWPTLTIETARQEVEESLSKGRISRVAYDDGVVGWVGASLRIMGLYLNFTRSSLGLTDSESELVSCSFVTLNGRWRSWGSAR